ncbi:MAG TPA: methyltransferase domain-containing protein [Terriglobales bacterium]|nr:methyltransferase domain-containing protein [Terriglobales bacterium]
MNGFRRLLGKIGPNKGSRPSAPLPEALPYPVQVRRRVFQEERTRKHGGLEVFDTPAAIALNESRMTHLASLGLDLAGKRVLDVGAGVGHLAARLQQMGCSVTCVEGRTENVASMHSRYPQLEGYVANVENEALSRFGRFHLVLSYGLLYHLENPIQSLRNMESVCEELLLLETIVCDHIQPLVRLDDESKDWNQALAGIAGRPSPHYVVLALNRAGFNHVYAPMTPPAHEDFRFEWKNNLDCARDGHNLRCIFVASRTQLKNPKLIPLLKDS